MGFFSNVWNAVTDFFEDVVEDIADAAEEAVEDIADGISDVISGIVDVGLGIVQVFRGIVTLDKDTALNGLADLATGIIHIGRGVTRIITGIGALVTSPIPVVNKITRFIADSADNFWLMGELSTLAAIEIFDNLTSKEKPVNVEAIYGNYVGNSLKGNYKNGYDGYKDGETPEEYYYIYPPINEFDFIFYLHDQETSRGAKGNMFADRAINIRVKKYKQKNKSISTEIRKAIRKVRMLGLIGDVRIGTDVASGILRILGSIADYGSITMEGDAILYLENKPKIDKEFNGKHLPAWLEIASTYEVKYSIPDDLNKWWKRYFEIGYKKVDRYIDD